MLSPFSLSLLLILPLPQVHGFVGMGYDMYNPSCAYACRSIIASAKVDCPTTPITPSCCANSAPFLTTLAYCIKDRCYPESNPTRAKVEEYWYKEATGDEEVAPMWGWQETYDKINGTPTEVFKAKSKITKTMLVDIDDWRAEKSKEDASEWQQILYARYTLGIFLTGVGIPILLTALSYLPFTSKLAHWVKPRLIYPTLLHRHVEPVFQLFHMPTLGQTSYILILFILTFTLCIVDYGNLFSYKTANQADILNYLGMRTGILSMALLPLTVLFAGRNNILLYLSNWSHSTYLLLHRWVARLCLLVVILHSLIEFVRYSLKGTYGAELAMPYVQWGIVGLFAALIMIGAGQFRKYRYELFLISHIILAIVFIVGTWYHLEYKFHRERGYQQWIYLCSGIWFFDRVFRLGRILKTGIRRATLTPIGEEVVRVDIEGIRWSAVPGQHAYLFLPAIRKWAPWENHPFSVIPTNLLSSPLTEKYNSTDEKSTPSTPFSSNPSTPFTSAPPSLMGLSKSPTSTTSGITVYIKRNKGLTKSLHSHPSSSIRALIDGPYRNTSSRPVLSSDRLILFAGGIGITGVLPFVHAHPNVKLYWTVRQEQSALVHELERTIPGHVERSILIGGRNDVNKALEAEVGAGWDLVGVVVCGPGRMCDVVRNQTARLGRAGGTKFELDVEAFLW